MKHRSGALALDVAFAVTEPWTVLFGASGSGKTTILRAIAGFMRPDQGYITVGREIVFDSSTKHVLPAFRRPVRSAAQQTRLFPNKTVAENIFYGGGGASGSREPLDIAEQVMIAFELSDLRDRFPRDLSGGEAQRVAVSRALVSAATFDGPETPLLLLDEPLAGLDMAARDRIIRELVQWTGRWKIPVLSVTHDIGEAFQLGADVVKIAGGQIIEQGPACAVLAREREQLLNQLEQKRLNALE